MDSDVWDFLDRSFEILKNIKKWISIRRAIEVGIEPTLKTMDANEKTIWLLKTGKGQRI